MTDHERALVAFYETLAAELRASLRPPKTDALARFLAWAKRWAS